MNVCLNSICTVKIEPLQLFCCDWCIEVHTGNPKIIKRDKHTYGSFNPKLQQLCVSHFNICEKRPQAATIHNLTIIGGDNH